ncbi:uncharacterized protein Tco025E_08257 [Trypanosoma conorhini]|uniref:Uncharacterized protein n=1 Tax=Trypanosoma conorhini TaxID=83891 RepID=A0A422NCK3_9TRYP|nr:uncharacterized protein Tco025E_08257 [Trypanosoma conorhini]RNF03039.1 hypothetical protein Tco025E_08257 [Trypanosoma conorhini]
MTEERGRRAEAGSKTAPAEEPQRAAIGGREKGEFRDAAAGSAKPAAPTTAVGPEDAAVRRVLEEKYWEKTHGFDPSKRGMPLFLALEHSPSKSAPMRSKPPERGVLKAEAGAVSALEPPQGEPEQKSLESASEKKLLDEELAMASHHDWLPKEETVGIEEPAITMPSVAPVKDEGPGGSQSIAQASQSGEAHQRRIQHMGNASGGAGEGKESNASDKVAVPEEAPSEKQKTATHSESEVEANVGGKQTLYTEGNQPFLSEPIEEAQGFPSTTKSGLKSPCNIHASEYADSVNMYQSNQGSVRSNMSHSITGSRHRGNTEGAIHGDEAWAKQALPMNGEVRRGSLTGRLETHALEGGAAPEGNEPPITSEGPPHTSELTAEVLRNYFSNNFAVTSGGERAEGVEYTDSSLYKTCLSAGTNDGGSLRGRRKLPKRYAAPNCSGMVSSTRPDPVIPPFHRRLLLDMEEKMDREKRTLEHSLNEYTFHPQTAAVPHGRLPQRRHKPTNAGGLSESPHQSSPAISQSLPSRRIVMEDPLPTFTPEISKFAREAPRSNLPYHERLYTPKAALPRAGTAGVSKGHSLDLSPRMLELIDNSTPPLFHPTISPLAMSIENGAPFHERLYQTKEEMERRRSGGAPVQSPTVSPRRSPRNIKLSPRLLQRPPPPPETLPYSFHPEISPRARSMEANAPVHQRLYPTKEERSAVLERQQKKFDEFLASFQPSITDRGSRAYEGSGVVRRNVVRRLTEPREQPQQFVDPALTFHPFITQKARDLKTGNLAASSWRFGDSNE